MTYATQASMTNQFGNAELVQLTDRGASRTNAIVTAVLDLAISHADAEIESYLAARYSVPLLVVPVRVQQIANDIARFRLYDNRATEEVRKRYEDARKWLSDVAAGKAALIDSLGAPMATQTQTGISAGPKAPARSGRYTGAGMSNFDTRFLPEV